MTRAWALQDAKDRLGEVVEAAQQAPQLVTEGGVASAAVISAADYRRVEHILGRKPGLVQHLLAIPKDDGGFERSDVTLRDVEF
ncbi:MAG TPA: type II toxin-antitoxin system prevent-host-death family antitoxin [Alphaproteobacteria bacterium]|nr:type II toxin-antitoxin system prevent-host-death family antitoxin [Alphaproteobacteria bacterium]